MKCNFALSRLTVFLTPRLIFSTCRPTCMFTVQITLVPPAGTLSKSSVRGRDSTVETRPQALRVPTRWHLEGHDYASEFST